MVVVVWWVRGVGYVCVCVNCERLEQRKGERKKSEME